MKKLIFTILLAAVLWTGHVFALDGSFREFLVDDDRFCAHTVRVCHLVQSRLVAGGEVELAECLAGTWHCCCFVGRFLVGRQGVILDVRFCPSAGGLHLWDERGRVSLAAGSIAAVADRAGGRDFLARLCATHAFQTLESECGFVVATLIYALVHAGSCNFMLVMAALVVGAAWGALYRFFPNRFCRYYLVSCSVGCGGYLYFSRYDYCLQK